MKKDLVKYFLSLEIDKELNSEELSGLQTLLEQASSAYYNSDKLILIDSEFDWLQTLYNNNSEELPIGSEAIKNEVSVNHRYSHLVGSLSKVNTLVELRKWIESTAKALKINLGKDTITLDITQKYDGNSVVAEFKDGKIQQVLTRGRDGKGMDLTHVFKDPNYEISNKEALGVRYEAMMTYANFDLMCKELNETYANPRSALAGKLSDDNAELYSKYFDLIPLSMSYYTNIPTREQQLDFIATNFNDFEKEISNDINFTKDMPYNSMSIIPNQKTISDTNLDNIISEIEKIYLTNSDNRNDKYMIDGLVIEFIHDKALKLGSVNNKPKHMVALKFPYMQKKSKVIGIEFDHGFSRITPCILFEPVTFNGAEQKRVSIANYKRFKELQLGIGSNVIIEYRNEVISYLTKADDQPEDIVPFEFQTHCSTCNTKLTINDNETFVSCLNPNCQTNLVFRITRYLKKLDIKGIKENTVEALINRSLIKNIPDLYLLTAEKLDDAGVGQKTANNILNALKKVVPYQHQLLAGIGIEDFGNTSSKVLLSKFTLKEILQNSYYKTDEFYNEAIKLEGLGEISVTKFINGLDSLYNELVTLYKVLVKDHNMKILNYHEEMSKAKDINTTGNVYSFVVTGSVNKWKNRKELTQYLESKGHTVKSAVSKDVNYLVNNDEDSTSSKNVKAKKLNIPIISEDQLNDLIN